MRYLFITLLFCSLACVAQNSGSGSTPAGSRTADNPSHNIFNIATGAELTALLGKEIYFSQMRPGARDDDMDMFFDKKVIEDGADITHYKRNDRLPYMLRQKNTYKITQVQDMFTGSIHLFCFTLTGPGNKTYYWYVHDFDVAPNSVRPSYPITGTYFTDYIEYIKKQYLNNDIYLSHDERGYTPNNSGKHSGPVFDEAWHCNEVIFSFYNSDNYACPYLRLSNDKGDSLLVPVDPYVVNGEDVYSGYFWAKERQQAYLDKKSAASAKQAVDSLANVKAIAKNRAELIKKYGKTTGTLIADGKVKKGMTTVMCETSWGYPDTRSESVFSGYRVEIWEYAGIGMLTFRNNILFEIIKY